MLCRPATGLHAWLEDLIRGISIRGISGRTTIDFYSNCIFFIDTPICSQFEIVIDVLVIIDSMIVNFGVT